MCFCREEPHHLLIRGEVGSKNTILGHIRESSPEREGKGGIAQSSHFFSCTDHMMTRLRKPCSAVHESPLATWEMQVSLTLQPGTFMQRVENKGLYPCQDLPSCFCNE